MADAFALDTQQVELMGRAWLASQLLRDNVEVAIPERDLGIDLIAYLVRSNKQPFAAYPVQLKAAQQFSFGFSRKYDKFHDLLFAFVWYLDDPAGTQAAFMTKDEVVGVCRAMGWTESKSWSGATKAAHFEEKRGGWRAGHRSVKLGQLLEPYIMKPGGWREKLETVTAVSGARAISAG